MAARATVIIPTFGKSMFARWAVKSVQRQTVTDIEICVICDGSPPAMVSLFESMARTDSRIRVFSFSKSPRTGEPYRDIVIGQTSGNIICYCCHDDLWLSNHVEEMEKALAASPFAHSLHAAVDASPGPGTDSILGFVNNVDLQNPRTAQAMLGGRNYFGLTFGAHTRKSYETLAERWITTPLREMPTDLYMWNKFLTAYPGECRTVRKITALCFPKPFRTDWSEKKRDKELARYHEKIQDVFSLRKIEQERQKFEAPVVVVFAADDESSGPLAISLLSLLENTEPDTQLRVFVLDGGLTDEAKNNLEKIAIRFRSRLEYLRTDSSMAAIGPAVNPFVHVPDLLPASFSRAICLESDILVKTDLMPLWRIDLAGLPLAAAEDSSVAYAPSLAFLKTQLDMLESDLYFNSGVMLLDLDLWRHEKYGEKILWYETTHPERIHFCGQDALNAILKNRWQVLPPRWNQQAFMYGWPSENVRPDSRGAWLEALSNPAIVHQEAEWPHPAMEEHQSCKNRTMTLWSDSASKAPRFASRTGRRKIVTISIVKNEEDIIESFVRYHCRFLDGMIILDNRSRDNTCLILRNLQQEGLPVTVLHDTLPGFDPGRKITAMARRALENEKADLVLLLDADEFIMAVNGAIAVRDILEKMPGDTLHFIKWRTYIPSATDDSGELFVPRRMRHIREEKADEFWKVALPGLLARDRSWSVNTGNHVLSYSPDRWPDLKEQRVRDLCLAHFPVRSVEQLQSKAIVGWMNHLLNPARRPGESFQWTGLFEKLKAGDTIGSQELFNAAKEYSSSFAADSVAVLCQPIPESQLGDIRMRYTSSSPVPWISRVLSHFETVALSNARLQRENDTLQFGTKNAEPARPAAQEELDVILQSRSWRMTAPLRAIAQVLRKIKRSLTLIRRGRSG